MMRTNSGSKFISEQIVLRSRRREVETVHLHTVVRQRRDYATLIESTTQVRRSSRIVFDAARDGGLKTIVNELQTVLFGIVHGLYLVPLPVAMRLNRVSGDFDDLSAIYQANPDIRRAFAEWRAESDHLSYRLHVHLLRHQRTNFHGTQR